MKNFSKIVLVLGALLLLVASMAEARGRKLPVGAYIKSAKIDIVSGDLDRYPEALAMLDSLAMHYGPHAEALYLTSQIYVDYIEQTAGPWDKKPYVESMVAYIDSLHMCCENEDIKKKYRDDCDEYLTKADSVQVKYWREFYNSGIEQLNAVQSSIEDLQTETDSTSRAFLTKTKEAKSDSCIANLQLAMVIAPESPESYVALGTLYEFEGEYEKAIEMLKMGMSDSTAREQLLLPIAYNYIGMDDYCGAIPYLKEKVEGIEGQPDASDLENMYNLTVCYNNCGIYDSAFIYYQEILKYAPENTTVLSSIGRYFNQQARYAADSARALREAEQPDAAAEWQEKVNEYFDSSSVYFKQAFQIKPENPTYVEDYAIVSYLREDWFEAARAFEQLTELQPEIKDHWVSLGDCLLKTNQFEKAVDAYESAVELTPDDMAIWENLALLYKELGQTAKAAEAEKKAENLRKN